MSRALLLVLALLLAPLARAQEAIDADYRQYDVVRIADLPEPLEGEILEGRDPAAAKIRIKTKRGVIAEFPRNKVLEIVERETPDSAFRSRSARIRSAGSAADHRLLGEWALKHALRVEAEGELRLAAEKEQDPARAQAHRERLLDLVEARLPELQGPARDAALEGILAEVGKAAAKGDVSPRLHLARARVALTVGLPEVARNALEQARDALEKKAGPAVAPPPEAAAGSEAAPPPTPTPTEKAPVFRRDGEGVDPDPDAPPAPAPPAQPGVPDDRSDAELAGLSHPERDVWRQAFLLLGELETRAGRLGEAAAAYERVLEVWPQERAACLGLARLRVSEGAAARAEALLGAALGVFPLDAELLLLRGQVRTLLGRTDDARQDLEQAQTNAQAEALRRDAGAALGTALVAAGLFGEADEALKEADAAPGHGLARAARALLAECQGDRAAARALYDEAQRLLAPRAPDVLYALSFLHAESGDLPAASSAVREAARQGLDLELALRALTDLAARRNDAEAEGRLLELHARAFAAPGPDLLARLGNAYLRQGRLEEAKALFERGLEAAPEHTGCLRGLAYHAYSADDRARARELLERLVKLDPKDAWTARGLRNLEEARTRRVWVDAFDRPGPDVKNSWRVDATFGVEVQLVEGRVRLTGRQQNEPDGKTRLARTIQGEQVVKLEARLVLDDLGPGARAGLRYEVDRGAGVVLFRDGDGQLKVTWSKARNAPLEDPRPLGEWPGRGSHVLAIEVEDPATGTIAVWCDGVRKGELKVPGLGRDNRSDVELSIYAQGTKLGDAVEAVVDDVRVYVRREPVARSGSGF